MRKWVVAVMMVAVLGWAGLSYLPNTVAQTGGSEKGTLSFELYKDSKDEFRWRLKAANGQQIGMSSHGYKAKADCMKAIDLIKMGAAKAKVDDQSSKKAEK